jgi:hypothetical protein
MLGHPSDGQREKRIADEIRRVQPRSRSGARGEREREREREKERERERERETTTGEPPSGS